MEFRSYKKELLGLAYGKLIHNSLYVYRDSLADNTNELLRFVDQLICRLEIPDKYNVIKFFTSEFKVSFLSYPGFLHEPHPVLACSLSIDLSTGSLRRFDYSKSDNPPILHRKEALLEPTHPLIPELKAMTKAEEAEGLYENIKTIGFKKNWERLLAEKGLAYKGHELVKRRQVKTSCRTGDVEIKRHKTAIARYNFSKPIQTVLEYNLLADGTTLFDYGCGHGDDVRALQNMGMVATGWDPVYAREGKKYPADIVNLGFVLNIIEDEVERTSVLQEAYSLSMKLLVVSSMIANSGATNQGRLYKDGILTSRGTFQKYFYQEELRQYIEDVLETTAVAVAPGIFYVFKNPIDQQEFLSERNKRAINWDELSYRLYPSRAKRRQLKREELYEKHKDILDNFWEKMLDLGRLPNEEEFDGYEELRKTVGSLNTARKIFVEKFGEETLNEAFQVRKNDLLVYMALANFKKRVPFKHLSSHLQVDIKTFVGSYAQALNESKKLLFSIGNPDVIESLCAETEFGFFDHKAMYIHKSLIKELHPILRIYTGCAGILYGDLHNADIIKIHRRSGKVTLLRYDDFDNKPLPELIERVKVNLRKQRIDIFDHQSGTRQQLLYFKENYVSKEHPKRPKWKKFSNKLRKIGFKDGVVIGPTKQEFLSLIEEKGLTINLNKRKKQKK